MHQTHPGPSADTMDVRGNLALLAFIIAASAAIEQRKVLNIPEKIIGGVIDIVSSHKHKPTQPTTVQQNQSPQPTQNYQQNYPQQYAPWHQTPNYGNQGYQNQNQAQFQGQQYANYGTYPAIGTTYPQGNYPVNSGPVYPTGPAQGGYGTSQSQNQGQYQTYPQNQGGQFQNQNQQIGFNQNQQVNQFQNQNQNQNNQFQVQNQNTQFVNQGQNTQFQGPNQQGQYPVQNQQNNQVGQNQQTTQFVNQGQTGHYQSQGLYGGGQNQQTSSFQGQNQGVNQGVNQGNLGGQNQSSGGAQSGFQVSGVHQSGTPGPSCVCHAWTKPGSDSEKSLEKTKPGTPK